MAYSAQTDIENGPIPSTILAQITDDTNGTTVDATKVTAAISRGDELIDGHLRSRYALPLSSTPALIKNISIALSAYYLYTRRIHKGAGVPETVTDQFKEAVKTLEKIQRGTVDPGIEDAASGITGSYKTKKTADDRQFTSTVIGNY